MDVRFRSIDGGRLEIDAGYFGGFSPDLVKIYRSRIHFIRQAQNETDLHGMKFFRFEKLKGSGCGQHSIRLNEHFRLVLEFKGEAPNRIAVVVGIEDYQ